MSTILIPLDGSELAERALKVAQRLGQQSERTLCLLRVVPPETVAISDLPVYSAYTVSATRPTFELQAEATAYLREIQKTLPAGINSEIALGEGEVASAILAAARDHHADLIVMSSHGYSGVTRWVLGSVAEQVVRHAPCPVLVIRHDAQLQRMLIPLDGSFASEQVLRPALDVAACLGCEVVLVQAIQPTDHALFDQLEGHEHGLGLRVEGESHERAVAYLRQLATLYAKTHALNIQCVVLHEPAAEGILHFAETHPIDLIAMATHGRSGLQKWVYGSVTEQVLHGALCSMLVMRP